MILLLYYIMLNNSFKVLLLELYTQMNFIREVVKKIYMRNTVGRSKTS